MFSALGFKDVASGFCNDVRSCYTEESTNPLLQKVKQNSISSRNVRMFVHEQTNVFSSVRNLTVTKRMSESEDRYGLGSISVSDKYGWLTTIGLPTCSEKAK